VINEALLSNIRSLAETIMTAEAVIYRKTSVSDSAGGFTDTYASVGSAPCSYAPYQITPLEREATVSILAVQTWRFQFPVGTEIHNTDRLVTDGRTFEVVSAGSGSIELSVRVICQEVV